MKVRLSSGQMRMLSYFFVLAFLGSLFLQIPSLYVERTPIKYIDSLFVSVSAVCVTGLSTVDMSVFNRGGFFVLMFLIEAGGLGILTFISMFLGMNNKKVSMVSSKLIRNYFVDDVEKNPRKILFNIFRYTAMFQLFGALCLMPVLKSYGIESFIFDSFFLSISAFCNAGFAPYSDSLMMFKNDLLFNSIIIVLIFFGGIGFVVMQNIRQSIFNRKKHISLHTKVTLTMTGLLIVSSFLFVFVSNYDSCLKGFSFGHKISASLFQAITTRTCGFETIPQAEFSSVSTLWTILMMFIGGSPASMAGGIKTSTFFVVLLYLLRGGNRPKLTVYKRDLSQDIVQKAFSIIAKSVSILFIVIMVLLFSERHLLVSKVFTEIDILFEAVSAFGTVGLSRGLTFSLSGLGKIIIIATMLIGRTGVFAMALQLFVKEKYERFRDYPEERVLIG